MMTNCMLIFFFFGLKFFFVRMTEIAFNKEMDFYFQSELMEGCCAIILQLKYMNKDNEVKIEEGEVQSAAIQEINNSVKSYEDLYS